MCCLLQPGRGNWMFRSTRLPSASMYLGSFRPLRLLRTWLILLSRHWRSSLEPTLPLVLSLLEILSFHNSFPAASFNRTSPVISVSRPLPATRSRNRKLSRIRSTIATSLPVDSDQCVFVVQRRFTHTRYTSVANDGRAPTAGWSPLVIVAIPLAATFPECHQR